MTINFAEKYARKVADKFYEESVILGKTSRDYDFEGVKTVNVYSYVTVDPVDYVRGPRTEAVGSAGNANQYYTRYGAPTEVQDTVQQMTITQDKAVSLVVDKGNNKQQVMIKNAGKVMQAELKEKFVPMFDKYALHAWANYKGIQEGVDATLSKTTIVESITKGMTALRNKSAFSGDCFLYIGATNFGYLLNSAEFLNLEKLGTKALEDGVVGKVRGLKVVVIPDDYLPAGNNSNKANFIIVNKKSVLAPTQIKDMRLHEDPVGISGALMEIRWLYDAFVIDAKKDGIYTSFTAAQSWD